MKTIPDKFYKGDNHPCAHTVRQLKKLLAELPDNLPVHHTWGQGPELVVFNHGQDSMHLEIGEPLEDNDD